MVCGPMPSGRRLLLALLLAAGLACAGKVPPPAPSGEPRRPFRAERSWDDLRALAAIGPRVSGSEGAERARAYLRGELEKLGLEVQETLLEVPRPKASEGTAEDEAAAEPPRSVVHLLAVIPGALPDVVLLAASYDSEPKEGIEYVAANASGSGPALVLELARALAADPLPYTTWLAFIDGDTGGAPVENRIGSKLWVRKLAADGDLERIRLAVFFRQVADADLLIHRDLYSHRIYREAFWRAAARVGGETAFPPDADFTTPSGSHVSFLEVGMRRVVAIVDVIYGGTEFPGAWSGGAEDTPEHCSAESLGTVGRVSLEALDELTRMLEKVDRLVPSAPPEEVQGPAPEGAGE